MKITKSMKRYCSYVLSFTIHNRTNFFGEKIEIEVISKIRCSPWEWLRTLYEVLHEAQTIAIRF